MTPVSPFQGDANPACESWCTTQHEPAEYANSSESMACAHSFLDSKGRRVDVIRTSARTPVSGIARLNPYISCEVDEDSLLSPDDAQLLADALTAAATFARNLIQQSDPPSESAAGEILRSG